MNVPRFQSCVLNEFLDQELSAGNEIVEDSPGWGAMTRLVILKMPFRPTFSVTDSALRYSEINDAHYWKAEVEDPFTREVVACRF